MYVARMDYQDVAQRKLDKATEMFWAPSPSQPLQGGVLGFLPYWYYAPGGFNFGGDDGTQPIMDDPTLEDYNVPDVVARFNSLIDDQVSFTAGQDTMIMMATDFSGENAITWYRNIDKLIHHVNAAGKYNLLYSTPSIYTAAKAATTPLPLRTEDVMPYADNRHAFWSGYFTSRPALKGYIRDSSAVFQAAKQLQALTGGAADMTRANPLYLLERAMGVTQHHDAVSGTAKQHVTDDYALRLARARVPAEALIGGALAALSGDAGARPAPCDLANATICPALEAGLPALVYLYNQQAAPLAHAALRLPVGLPAGVASYAVAGPTGAPLPAQLVDMSSADAHLRTAYYNHSSAVSVAWLAFNARDVPPMGFAVYFVTPVARAQDAPLTALSGAAPAPHAAAAAATLSNGLVTLTFDAASGLLASFTPAGGAPRALSQTFLWYNSSTGNTTEDAPGSDNEQHSGAYIFRPNGTSPFAVSPGPVALDTRVAGPVVWEARQTFAPWATQVVRLFANSSDVEFEFTIGPIPFADGLGKEIVSRFTSDLTDSGGAWVSDSNGRDAITRRRDHRASFNYTVFEPVAGNMVPVNLFTSLASPSAGLTLAIATDRTQAGASLLDGSLELMVHRRLLADDDRGVGEPLNETGVNGAGLIVRGVHRLRLDGAASAGRALRKLAAGSLFKPLARFARNEAGTPAAWLGAAGHRALFTGLAAPLPPNLHLVTVHSLGPGRLLLRLAHMFGEGEDAALSRPATVDLAGLFAGLRVLSATEMVLGGPAPLAAAPVTTYTLRGGGNVTLPVVPPAPAGPGLTVTLSAMQIRTFECQVAAK